MKIILKIRFLNIFCILVLAFTSTTCRKEEPKCGEVIINNSWITNPKWMANFIHGLVNTTSPPFDAITVNFIEYNEQVYFGIYGYDLNTDGSGFVCRNFFLFTCWGERIYSEFTHPDELLPGTLGWDLFFLFNREINRITIWERGFFNGLIL